ncbi:Hypothetical protein PHPALM_3648 [Phytophthora palmivora]|uniref:Uncharacterized protein n=1 Tax=Phytophthora palmivora TaxID=4796 RepID=A0A2P4YLV6_9STRA|nr:Hypothetical protein PHPALM_3648 [Phytophthora palmivora]
MRDPFADTSAVTKVNTLQLTSNFVFIDLLVLCIVQSEFKGYVKTLNLGFIKLGNETIEGNKILDFRGKLWLHTTAILMPLLVLMHEYPGEGNVDPTFHAFVYVECKEMLQQDTMLQVACTQKNYVAIEKSMCKVMEVVLRIDGRVRYTGSSGVNKEMAALMAFGASRCMEDYLSVRRGTITSMAYNLIFACVASTR